MLARTELAFSRPWGEALNLRVLPVMLDVFATSVDGDGSALVRTPTNICKTDMKACRIGGWVS